MKMIHWDTLQESESECQSDDGATKMVREDDAVFLYIRADLLAGPQLLDSLSTMAAKAARVVENWESGDLAQTVRDLNYARREARKLIDGIGAATPAPNAMRILESLTPMRSEYHNDPERCAAYIQDCRNRASKLIARLVQQRNTFREALRKAYTCRASMNSAVVSVIEEALWPGKTKPHEIGDPNAQAPESTPQ